MSEEKPSPAGIIVVVAVIAGVIGIMIGKSGSKTEPVVENQPPPVEKAKPAGDGVAVTGETENTGSKDGFLDEEYFVRVKSTQLVKGNRTLHWHPDKKFFATSGVDGVVRVWGSDGGLSKSIPVHSGIVYCVRWSPDGKSLAVAGQGGFLGVIAGEDDKLTKAISSHEGDVLALDWSPDSKRLASGGRDKTIHITDIEKVNSDSVVVGPFDAAVMAISWSSKKNVVAVGIGAKGPVSIVSPHDGSIIEQIQNEYFNFHNHYDSLLSWSEDGKFMVVGGGGRSQVIDLETKLPKGFLKRKGSAVSFSRNGNNYLSGTSHGDGFHEGSGGVFIVNSKSGSTEQLLRTNNRSPRMDVTGIGYSPDNARIAACYSGGNNNVMVWCSMPAKLVEMGQEAIKIMEWGPNSELLATVTSQEQISLLNVKTGEQHLLKGHIGSIRSLSWKIDGSQIASTSTDNTCRVWGLNVNKQVSVFQHPDNVNDVRWSPNGETIATACTDGVVRFWDAKSEELKKEFAIEPKAAVVSLDWVFKGEKLIVGTTTGKVIVVDCGTNNAVAEYTVAQSYVNSIQWFESLGAFSYFDKDKLRLFSLKEAAIQSVFAGEGYSSFVDEHVAKALVKSGMVYGMDHNGWLTMFDSDGRKNREVFINRREGVTSVSVSEDMSKLAVGLSGGKLRVVDISGVKKH